MFQLFDLIDPEVKSYKGGGLERMIAIILSIHAHPSKMLVFRFLFLFYFKKRENKLFQRK